MICIAAVLQALFADIYAKARKAKPGLGHRALAQVGRSPQAADICSPKIIPAAHTIIRIAAALQAFFANIYAEARKARPGLTRRQAADICSPKIIPAAHTIIRIAAALQAFFADIYAEACKAKPGLGHRALAQVAGGHKLLRHYTMNIDGLAEAAGMDTWHVDNNPAGESQDHTVTCLSMRMLQFPLPPGDTSLYSQLWLMFGVHNDE